jgi:hypothetical protein
MSSWYYKKSGQEIGPIPSSALKQLAATGQLFAASPDNRVKPAATPTSSQVPFPLPSASTVADTYSTREQADLLKQSPGYLKKALLTLAVVAVLVALYVQFGSSLFQRDSKWPIVEDRKNVDVQTPIASQRKEKEVVRVSSEPTSGRGNVVAPRDAVAVSSAPTPARTSAPSLEFINPALVLRGERAMSIRIFVDGIQDIPVSTYRADIEAQLRDAGITILPDDQWPKLSLNINAMLQRDSARMPMTIFTVELEFRQYFPIQHEPGKPGFVKATTWSTAKYGVMSSILALSVRSYANDLTTEFIKKYKEANSAPGSDELRNLEAFNGLKSQEVMTLEKAVYHSFIQSTDYENPLQAWNKCKSLDKDTKVICADYQSEDLTVRIVRYYWYKKVPDGLDDLLKQLRSTHPIFNIRAACDSAPNRLPE